MLPASTRLVYLVGTLYSKTEELRALLREMAASGEGQGELHLTHYHTDGRAVRLVVHVDGEHFTVMEAASGTTDSLRLDVSDPRIEGNSLGHDDD